MVYASRTSVKRLHCFMQVFDLAANKRDPVSKQKIHAKAGLTRISFNTHHPVLLIGDDRSA